MPAKTMEGEERPQSTGLVGDEIANLDASEQTFADQPVAEGYSVVVQSDPNNNDNIEIRDDDSTTIHILEPSGTFSANVNNLNQITLFGTANDPTVRAAVEAP